MFTAGQRVRLIATFTSRCLTYRDSPGPYGPRQPVVLKAGAVFTVLANRRLNVRCEAARPEAVVVQNEKGNWCIPTRLLEPVEQQPKESNGDAASDRVW